MRHTLLSSSRMFNTNTKILNEFLTFVYSFSILHLTLKFCIQIEKIESGELEMNTFVAKTMIKSLADSTSRTETMFGNDINITLRIVNKVLDHENQQSGLSLTSEQDSTFLYVSLYSFNS